MRDVCVSVSVYMSHVIFISENEDDQRYSLVTAAVTIIHIILLRLPIFYQNTK